MLVRRGAETPDTASRRDRNGRAATRAILTALCAAALAVAVTAPAGAVAVKQGLFQSYEKRSPKIQIFSKWNGFLGRARREARVGEQHHRRGHCTNRAP